MKKKIKIQYRNCPRCKKVVAGLNRPIHGSKQAFEKFKGICEKCVTIEEEREILEDQSKAFTRRTG